MTEHRQKLLIVEDDLDLQKQLKWSYEGFDVFCVSSREEALAVLREVEPDTKIIVVSGHGAPESALRAISAGAWDVYHKPVDIDALHLIIRRALHVRELETPKASLQQPDSDGALLLGTIRTASPEMVKVARTIERIAPADISVLRWVRAARERNCWRAVCTMPVVGTISHLLPSTAAQSLKICWNPNCSAMKKARLPALLKRPRARLSWHMVERYFWMKWATSL